MRLYRVACLTAVATLWVTSAVAARDPNVRCDVRISEPTLGEALSALSRQCGAPLLYPYDLARTRGIQPVSGRRTIPEALAIMLRDTPFTGELTASGVITISRPDASGGKNMSRTSKTSWLTGASALVLSILGPNPAHAAEPATATTIEELIVTATKREESLQKVPLAITALSGEQLASRGVESFAELARLVPGVTQSGSSQFSKFTVRGIQTSNTTSSSGEQKPVAVYLDDLPLTSFSILTPEISPYDLSRVEVLRGPQGTLFGSGTLAGAVRYVTNKPDTSGFDASAEADLGVTKGDSYRRRFAGMVNVPLLDGKLAVRAVGYSRDEDGYVTNVLLNQEHPDYVKAWGGRIAAKLEVSDDFNVTAMVTSDRVKNGDSSRFTLALGTNKASSRIPYTTNADVKTYSLSGSYTLPWATIESSTTLARVKTDWGLHLNAVTLFPYYIYEAVEADTVVEDLRVVSKGNKRLDYVVGVFYLNQKSDYQDIYNTEGGFVRSRNITGLQSVGGFNDVFQVDDRRRKNMEAALYGEVTFHITETLRASVGLRETRFKYSDEDSGRGFNGTTNFTNVINAGGNRAVVLPRATPIILSTGFQNKLTQKYNLSWQPSADQNYYALASQGLRRGHPNSNALVNNGRSLIDPSDPTIIPLSADSDSLWNYELGAKTRWFDGRFQANLALYYIDWGPMQVNLVRQSDTKPYVGNAGKSTSKGVELELQARPERTIDLGANITIQRARISSLSAQEGLLSGAVPGARLASPDFQIYAYAQKTWELADGASAFGRIDVQHVGSYPNSFPLRPGSTLPNANYFTNPSYTNINLSAGWEKGRLSIVVYGENIADNDDVIYINASSSTSNRALTLRPRTIGVRTGWKY